MAETVKKTSAKPKAPAKPGKTAASKKGVNGVNGASTNVTEMPAVSYDQVAMLAHQLWMERGHEHGSDADDWFRAEQMLRSKAS
jgi:cytochrome c